ncbi:hypothetical protein [Mycobacterium marinum]|uniref:FDXHR family putative zinc-binding protein n=1 Tax=Mycobacterium marinum TaxID=1781 RepID=UPI003B8A7BE4
MSCCTGEFSGLKTAHCSICHATFTTTTAFDRHRTGSYSNNNRRCLPPESVGLTITNRSYPCWGYPPKEIAA